MSKFAQSFKNMSIDYELDEYNHCLVVVGETDLQEKVNSLKETTLSYIYQRFIDENIDNDNYSSFNVEKSEEIIDCRPISHVKADIMLDACNQAHDLRDRYGFSDDVPFDVVSEAIKNEYGRSIKNGEKNNEESKS